MKKYKLQIKIIDIELNKGPVISLPFDMVQEAKTDILKELIEATIEEMERAAIGSLSESDHKESCGI